MATLCSVGSTTTRRRRRGSSTSTRNGPTERSPRSTSGAEAAHHVLGAAVAHVDERVDHAEVRVLAVAEDGEPVTRARVHVEVVAVVEVAVARGGVGDELGRLVDGVVVPGGEGHVGVLSSTRSRCRSRPPPVRRTWPPVGLGRQAGGGEDGEQAPGAHVPVGAAGRRVGIGHGPALVEDGVTGRTAEFVDGHGGGPPRPGSLREDPRGLPSPSPTTAGRLLRLGEAVDRHAVVRGGVGRQERPVERDRQVAARGPVPSRRRPS